VSLLKFYENVVKCPSRNAQSRKQVAKRSRIVSFSLGTSCRKTGGSASVDRGHDAAKEHQDRILFKQLIREIQLESSFRVPFKNMKGNRSPEGDYYPVHATWSSSTQGGV